MFSKKYGFRYSDLDCDGKIKISTLIDLLQDVSIMHLSSRGMPPSKLKEMNLAFLLEGWHIRLESPLTAEDDAVASTGIMKITEIRTNRKYEITQGGERKVTATAVWYAVDTERMKVARLSEEFFDIFESITEADNCLPYVSLRPEKDFELVDERKVERRDLDTNRHQNNVKSVEIVLEYLPEDFALSELSVKYRKEILKGETMKIYSKKADGAIAFQIANEEGDICIIAEAK